MNATVLKSDDKDGRISVYGDDTWVVLDVQQVCSNGVTYMLKFNLDHASARMLADALTALTPPSTVLQPIGATR